MRTTFANYKNEMPTINDLKSFWKTLRTQAQSSSTVAVAKAHQKKNTPYKDIAIVGMGISLGALHNLSSFERRLFDGIPNASASDEMTASAFDLNAFEEAFSNTGLNLSEIIEKNRISVIFTNKPDTDNSLVEAIEQATFLLSQKKIDGVLIGTQDETSGAIFLMENEAAKNRNIRRYATIKNSDKQEQAAPFDLVNICGNIETEFLETTLSFILKQTQSAAIISSEECLSELGTVSPITGLILTVLSIHHRYIPAKGKIIAHLDDKIQDVFKDTSCHRPQFSYPWFKKTKKDRAALLTFTSSVGKLDSLQIYEADWHREESLFARLHHIFPITAKDNASLKQELYNICQGIEQGKLDYERFKNDCWKNITSGHLGVTASIIAKNLNQLQKEAQQLISHLDANSNLPWKMPSGSCFFPAPSNGKVALVYPGGFTAYPYLANGLLRLFPRQFQQLEEAIDDLGKTLADYLIFPKSLRTLEGEDFMELETTGMLKDIPAITSSISCLGIIYTKVLQEIFELNHQVAFGYSLGDSTVLYANGVWDISSSSTRLVHSSHLFKNTLSGNHNFLREKWQLNDKTDKDEIWLAYVLFIQETLVREELHSFDRVFLTHINSPNELMVSGSPKQLNKLIKRLNCKAIQVPIPYVIHNTIIEELSADFDALFCLPTHQPAPELQLISAGKFDVYDNYEPAHISKLMTKGYLNTVNFPKMVSKAIELGVETFIEVGPGGTCTRWVADNLPKKEGYHSFTISQRGKTDVQSMEQLLAKLISLQIPMALDKLCPPEIQISSEAYRANGRFTEQKSATPIQEALSPSKISEEDLFYWDFHFIKKPAKVFENDLVEVPLVSKTPQIAYQPAAQLIVPPISKQLLNYDAKSYFKKQMNNIHRSHNAFLRSNAVFTDALFSEINKVIDDAQPVSLPFQQTKKELIQKRFISDTKPQINERKGKFIKPILKSKKQELGPEDIQELCNGALDLVFGKGWQSYTGNNLKLSKEVQQLVHIIYFKKRSSPSEVYTLKTQKTLTANELNIQNLDEGTLINLLHTGAVELLKTFALSIGLHQCFQGVQFIPDQLNSDQVRQYPQANLQIAELVYVIDIYETGFLPRPYIKADIKIYGDASLIMEFNALTLRLIETTGISINNRFGAKGYYSGRRLADGTPVVMNEFQVAHSSLGKHLIALGEDFAIYDRQGQRGVRLPNGDFQFVDRVVSVTGERKTYANGSMMEIEYDVPTNIWYLEHNGFPAIPASLYLEAALQASVFLGYFLGATLNNSTTNFSVRNLEGKANFLKDLDVRGKTIRFTSTLLSTQSVHGSILQNFSFSLRVDERLIYEGESLFGYFQAQALENQLGLDNGQTKDFWHLQQGIEAKRMKSCNLQKEINNPLFESTPDKPHYRLGVQQLNLLHQAKILTGGGKYGLGYVYGYKNIKPTDWYFTCHFHQDPVMPGSLGIEALYQALQLYIIEHNIGRNEFNSPKFGLALDIETTWKYRGQILRTDPDMSIELHIKEIKKEKGRILVIADGDLFKGNLRCYYIHDFAIAITEAYITNGLHPK